MLFVVGFEHTGGFVTEAVFMMRMDAEAFVRTRSSERKIIQVDGVWGPWTEIRNKLVEAE
jgi:hypothetical protein